MLSLTRKHDRDYWDHFVITNTGFHWTVVMAAVLITPFLIIAALPVLLPVLAAQCRRNAVRSEVVLYWLAGLRYGCRRFTVRYLSSCIRIGVAPSPLCLLSRAVSARLRVNLTGSCYKRLLPGRLQFLPGSGSASDGNPGRYSPGIQTIPILDVLDDKVAPAK